MVLTNGRMKTNDYIMNTDKPVTFRWTKDTERYKALLEKAVDESGMTQPEWLRAAIIEKLEGTNVTVQQTDNQPILDALERLRSESSARAEAMAKAIDDLLAENRFLREQQAVEDEGPTESEVVDQIAQVVSLHIDRISDGLNAVKSQLDSQLDDFAVIQEKTAGANLARLQKAAIDTVNRNKTAVNKRRSEILEGVNQELLHYHSAKLEENKLRARSDSFFGSRKYRNRTPVHDEEYFANIWDLLTGEYAIPHPLNHELDIVRERLQQNREVVRQKLYQILKRLSSDKHFLPSQAAYEIWDIYKHHVED